MTTLAMSLRVPLDGDLPHFFEFQRDEAAVRVAAVLSRERAAFDAHWAAIRADASVTARTIVAAGRVAGFVVCFERAGLHELGYWVGREFWGRGLATRALLEFIELEPRRPLHARVAKHNVASLRVCEKCGFRVVGEDRWSPWPELPAVDELVLEFP